MRSVPWLNAPTALALARERATNLVLANVMTRTLDGFDLVREFRLDARVRVVPIILYSAPAGEDDLRGRRTRRAGREVCRGRFSAEPANPVRVRG
jgi:CheY-like chemotaxis protein